MLNQPVPLLADICVLQPDIPWSIHFGMNAPIDFCIWILELDGLHVQPFTYHEKRIGALQKLGLTPELWEVWATAVIALENPAFYWNREQLDMDTWVAKKLVKFKELVTALLETPAWADQAASTVDFESLIYPLKSQYQQDLQRYNDAIAHLNKISPQLVNEISASDKQLPAASLIPQTLRANLQELWDLYDRQVYLTRVEATASLGEQTVSTGDGKLYDLLKHLSVYVVSYPFKLEWLVPPESVVTSNRHLLPSTDAMDELIERTVHQLAHTYM